MTCTDLQASIKIIRFKRRNPDDNEKVSHPENQVNMVYHLFIQLMFLSRQF